MLKYLFKTINYGLKMLLAGIACLRPQQWSKNLLIFVPLLLGHQYNSIDNIMLVWLVFLQFSLLASAAYIVNDVLDKKLDKIHPYKKFRPIAAGVIRLPVAYLMVDGLVTLVIAILLLLPVNFIYYGLLISYAGLVILYSLWLKKILMLDIFILTSFYLIRVIIGAVVLKLPLTIWFLSFFVLLFLSLSILKRYSDILMLKNFKQSESGYVIQDTPLLLLFGVVAGYLSIGILALYLEANFNNFHHYSSPEFLWLLCPILLYGISRLWFLAYRGQVTTDPLFFIMDDKVNWLLLLLLGGCFFLAINY